MLDQGRRVLEALALWRDHEGNERQLGVELELLLVRGAPQHPLVSNLLVAEIGADLDRIWGELGAKDAVNVGHLRLLVPIRDPLEARAVHSPDRGGWG